MPKVILEDRTYVKDLTKEFRKPPTFFGRLGRPYVTFAIIVVSLGLYSFFSTGYELYSGVLGFNLRLLWPVWVLFHGYDDHLIGSISYFVFCSSALEMLARHARQTGFRYARWWYIMPFLSLSLLGVFGLSNSIESMLYYEPQYDHQSKILV